MNQEEKSRIEELKKSLYSRVAPDIRTKRRLRFHEQDVDVKTDWEHPKEVDDEIELNKKYKDTSMSFFKKLLVFSIIIFIIALGAGAYLLFNGSNIVSANNVDIKITGPVSVAGGEPFTFDIGVSNKNNIKLQTVDLSIDYPTGTVDPTDTTKELKNTRELIPDIDPNGTDHKTVNAIVYGEENTEKEVKVTVEYRINGSNSVFQKEQVFNVLINSSPLSLSVSSFKEVTSGQNFELDVTMTSNSNQIMKNLLLKANYPFGFTYISSDLKPISNTTVWGVGDIPPGGKKTVKIKGKLEGQDDESRIFTFSAGAQSSTNNKIIGTEFISNTQEVSIKKPFISLETAFDANTNLKEYVGSFDTPIKVEVSYFNNLPTTILDGEVHVKLSGTALDKFSVSPSQGLYHSENNEIVWNEITNSELKSIGAGESGKVRFDITPRNFSTVQRPVIDPSINISVSMNGNRSSETDVPENVVVDSQYIIKVGSDASLSGQIVRKDGPFENTGPIPPKAEQATTYTVIWTVDNTSSNVNNAVVTAVLPSYVKWLGRISPSGEDINYNNVNGQIIWNVGNVGTYTMNSSRRRQVAFQISLTPSVTQIGNMLDLVGKTTLTAQDNFTNQPINSNLSSLNTRFSTDSSFISGDENVTQ